MKLHPNQMADTDTFFTMHPKQPEFPKRTRAYWHDDERDIPSPRNPTLQRPENETPEKLDSTYFRSTRPWSQ